MDSDSEFQICEQSDTSDLVDVECSISSQKNLESQIENSCEITKTMEYEKDRFLKECQASPECVRDVDRSNNIKDKVVEDEMSTKLQNSNPNSRKRKSQGMQKKVLTPMMKNALKQSKQEVSLMECVKKTNKTISDTKVLSTTNVVEKEEIKSSKIRSVICIDISEAPPVKMPKKLKPSNSLLNKISNTQLNNPCSSSSTISEKSANSTVVDRRPSNLVISNLKKQFNCSKEEAVRKYVEKCREEKSKPNHFNHMENKLVVQSNEMPWIPNLNFLDKNHFTNLSDADHKRYVAITMNLIQQNPEFRFTHNVTELKDFDNRLQSERALFYKISFDAIDAKKKSCYQFKLPYWKQLMYSCTEARSKNLKKFDKTQFEIIDNYEYNSTVEPLPLNVLSIFKKSYGDGPIITIPDLRKRCFLNSKIVHEKKKFYNVNNIIDDKNTEIISSNYDAKVIMDATTFSRLLIGKWGCDNLEYAFPITVTKQFVNGSLGNVITISKPIPAGPPSTRTLAYKVMKYVVKGGVDKSYFDVPKKSDNNFKNEFETHDFIPSSPTHEDNISTSNVTNIMNEDNTSQNICFNSSKIYHVLNLNVRTSDPSFNILIRSNCAARDCFGNKLSLSQHIEYFPEVGAENLFPEEIVHNYIKCFFKDASHAVIFRVHNSSCNILQKEFIDLNRLQTRVSNECLNIWKSGLQKIRNILTKLMTVSGGEYLLEEDGSNYKLYSEVDLVSNDTSEGQNEFCLSLKGTNEEDRMLQCRALKSSGIFNGVSYHVPLMWNFVLSRIPGSLPKRKNMNQNSIYNNKKNI